MFDKDKYIAPSPENCEKRNEYIKSRIVTREYPKNRNFKDLTGMDFGLLHVEYYYGQDSRKASYFMCKCKCGNEILIKGARLVRKNFTKSCGCISHQLTKEAQTGVPRTHGFTHTRLYHIWNGFRGRCNNPNNKDYKRYGGRGITYAKEWDDFMVFRNWAYNIADPPYTDFYEENKETYISIDRIDNNKGYFPDNCRFATYSMQYNNKTNNVYLQYKNYVYSATIWMKIMGYDKTSTASLISSRKYAGWTDYDAITIKPGADRYSNNPNDRQSINIYIAEDFQIYNKYNEFIKKGKAIPYIINSDSNNYIQINDTKIFTH